MNVLFRSLLVVLMACSVFKARAQQMAYVYIQGDKQTPFYVKLEGVMMERYGKNYFILPQMEAGPADIEILFQQNTIPAQRFTILIPEGGSRGFLITKYQGSYALYDLQQQFYLMAGNKAEDDHVPVFAAKATGTEVSALPDDEEPVVVAKEEPVTVAAATPKEKATKQTRVKKESPFKPVAKVENAGQDPQFINNIELNNSQNGEAVAKEKSENNNSETVTAADSPGIPKLATTFQNSDCPKAMDDADFEKLYKLMGERKTDEDKIDFLGNQMDKCYLCWQARTVANALSEDASRFVFLKKVYSRIADQQSFYLLDDLLRTDTWKAQFQELVHH